MLKYENNFRIVIVAGETSGDILGAGLINALNKICANIKFFGVTGPLMKKSGCESWYDIRDISIIGFMKIIRYFPKLLKLRNKIIKKCYILKPHVFIGIDYPDFNFSIEKILKKSNIPIIHYVSPSVWAWRKNRIFKMKKIINLILLLFPFEKKIYDKIKIPNYCIGHTIADKIPLYPNKLFYKKKLNILIHEPCVALLPGSRDSEIKILSPIFIKAISLLKIKLPKLQILVPLINEKHQEIFKKIKNKIAPDLNILNFNYIKTHDILLASDIALIASGTASLECMIAKCPMVVAYKLNFFNFLLAKCLIKTNYISLPNILAKKNIVKEFLQYQCSPTKLMKELNFLLCMSKYKKEKLLNIFRQLHYQIKLNANKRAAIFILKFLKIL